MHGPRRYIFMAGEGLKMAEDGEVSVFQSLSRSGEDINKENIPTEQNMKTVSSAYSPFLKSGSKNLIKILSDDEIQKGIKSTGTGSSKSKNKSNKRKGLATLQQTSDGQGKLTGNGRESTLSIKDAFKRKQDSKHLAKNVDVKVTPVVVNTPPSTVNSKLQDIKEPSSTITEDQKNTDDQLVQEALQLMKQTEKVDDSYWKNIAEERREALEKTLAENKKLYDKVEKLTQENEDLKQQLSEAECYKILYRNLLLSTQKEQQDDL